MFGSSMIALLGGASKRYSQLEDEKRQNEQANRTHLADLLGKELTANWDIMGPEQRQAGLGQLGQLLNIKPEHMETLQAIGGHVYNVMQDRGKTIKPAPQPPAPSMPNATFVPQAALAPMPPLPTTATVPEAVPYQTAAEARSALSQRAMEQTIRTQIDSARASGIPEDDVQALELSLRSQGRMMPLYTARIGAEGRENVARINQGGIQGKPVPWNVFDQATNKYRVANVVTTRGGASYEVNADGTKTPFVPGFFDRPYKDQGIGTFITPQNKAVMVDRNVVFPGISPSGNRAMVTEPLVDVRPPTSAANADKGQFVGTTPDNQAVIFKPGTSSLALAPIPGSGQINPRTATPIPDRAQERISGGLQSLNALDNMERLAPEVTSDTPIYSWIAGTAAKLGVKAGFGGPAAEWESIRNQFRLDAQSMIKGTPSNFDVQTVIATMPDMSQSTANALQWIKTTKEKFKREIGMQISYYKGTNKIIPTDILDAAKRYGINVAALAPNPDPWGTTQGSAVPGQPTSAPPRTTESEAARRVRQRHLGR